MKKRRRIIRKKHKRRAYTRKDGTDVRGADVRETTYFRDIEAKRKGKKRKRKRLRVTKESFEKLFYIHILIMVYTVFYSYHHIFS